MSTKGYSVTITWNNEKSKLIFPVLPEKISIKRKSNNSKVNVCELGEIIEKGTPNATTYSWSCFFPLKKSPLVEVKDLRSPKTYVDKLSELMKNQTPVHLVIAAGAGVSDYCLITELSCYEEGGDVGTVFYSINFAQYKTVKVRKLTKSTAKKPANNTSRPSINNNTKSKSNTYTVKTGDCLWSIAQAKLKDGSKWTKIWDLNSTTIINTAKKRGVKATKNYPIIYTGTVLKLP